MKRKSRCPYSCITLLPACLPACLPGRLPAWSPACPPACPGRALSLSLTEPAEH
jgi:hypothetical protein